MGLSKREINDQFLYGYQMAFGTDIKRRNWQNIFALWMASAKEGHTRAQFYVGTCYDNALGVAKDTGKAYQWYLKAAKKAIWKRN